MTRPIYDESVSQLDYRNPKFKFTCHYEFLKEDRETWRKERNRALSDFLRYFVSGGFIEWLVGFPDISGDLVRATVAENYYKFYRRAVTDSDRRYAQYVKDQKARSVVFLDSRGTEPW
jgi:hypothetical protein